MTAPGWYRDRRDDRLARWHDGQRWTQHTMVMSDWKGPGAPPPPREPVFSSPPADRRSGRMPAWFLPVVLAGAVVAVGVVFLLTRNDSGTGSKKVAVHGQTIVLDTPAKVAQALNAKGFECTGFKDVNDREDNQLGTDYSTGRGTCMHDGKAVTIDTYQDARHTWAQLAEIDALGCSIGKAFGVTEYNIAYGSTWASNWDDTLDHVVPRQMADALGGKFHHHDC